MIRKQREIIRLPGRQRFIEVDEGAWGKEVKGSANATEEGWLWVQQAGIWVTRTGTILTHCLICDV